jgi:hypothetical protein
MKPEDIRKLLGGYAPGTLTEEERKALFEAALSDQGLFDELAGEQALKELLEDDSARRQLLRALGEKPALTQRLKGWLGRPVSWAVAGSLAAVVLLVAVFVRTGTPPPKPEPVLIAKHETAPVSEFERPAAPSQAAPARRAFPEPKTFSPPPPAPREKSGAVEAKIAAVPLPKLSETIEVSVAKQELRGTHVDSAQLGAINAVAGSAGLAARQSARLSLAAVPAPIRYRILRADVNNSYTEVAPQTVFQSRNLVRVAFEPSESGRLQVTSAGAEGNSKVVFENSVEKGAAYNVDVPPGEQKLVAVFSPQTPAAAITVEILIRRQPAR